MASCADTQVSDLASILAFYFTRRNRWQQIIADTVGVGEITFRKSLNPCGDISMAIDDATVVRRSNTGDIGIAHIQLTQHKGFDLRNGIGSIVDHGVI